MIQDANAPGEPDVVNFGHCGSGSDAEGAFIFLSWHRYFLYRLELELQKHVPGVMLPYWDWTYPTSITTDTFLEPDGGAGDVVQRRYFAVTSAGNPVNGGSTIVY